MNFIWTIWTKPMAESGTLYRDMAYLAMSVGLVNSFSEKTTIYTDAVGKSIIRNLNIQADVINELDRFDNLDNNKWALPKISIQSKQTKPFCHIDYDVMLSKRPPMYDSDLTVQCIEQGSFFTFHYRKAYMDWVMDGNKCPEEMKRHIDRGNLYGLNVGYLQFNNLDFLKRWATRSMKMFPHMKTFIHNNNIFPEQFLLYCMTKNENISVTPLLDQIRVHAKEDMVKWGDTSSKLGYQHIMYTKNEWLPNVLEYLQTNNEQCLSYLRSKLIH